MANEKCLLAGCKNPILPGSVFSDACRAAAARPTMKLLCLPKAGEMWVFGPHTWRITAEAECARRNAERTK